MKFPRFWRKVVYRDAHFRKLYFCKEDFSYCPEIPYDVEGKKINEYQAALHEWNEVHGRHDFALIRIGEVFEAKLGRQASVTAAISPPGIYRVMLARDGEIAFDAPLELKDGRITLKIRKDSGF
jgi:hypothetical protein